MTQSKFYYNNNGNKKCVGWWSVPCFLKDLIQSENVEDYNLNKTGFK